MPSSVCECLTYAIWQGQVCLSSWKLAKAPRWCETTQIGCWYLRDNVSRILTSKVRHPHMAGIFVFDRFSWAVKVFKSSPQTRYSEGKGRIQTRRTHDTLCRNDVFKDYSSISQSTTSNYQWRFTCLILKALSLLVAGLEHSLLFSIYPPVNWHSYWRWTISTGFTA